MTRSLWRNGWTPWHLVAAVTLAGIALALTWEAWAHIFYIASRDEEASHIFLVPIVFAWLIWVRRRRLRYCEPAGLWLGPLLLLIGWAFYSIGDGYMIQSMWHLGAVLAVLGAFFTVIGRNVALQFLPALIVLGFLVPIPATIRQQIAIPLQGATAYITEQTLMVFGMPIGRSGNLLSINGVEVAIVEACNGLRMVFALALVSFAFAFSIPLRGYVRAIVILASPISAILCNVVRLIPTVWLYGYTDVNVADAFHDWSGWLMLGVALLLLIAIIRLLRWALVPVTPYTLATN